MSPGVVTSTVLGTVTHASTQGSPIGPLPQAIDAVPIRPPASSHEYQHRSVRKRVAWKDLVPLTRAERVWECTLSLPWLVGACFAYNQVGSLASLVSLGWSGLEWSTFLWLFAGAACSFFFFLTGLRQSHNAQHSCLGIGRLGHDLMLMVLSVLMLSSMHAVRVVHLHHHRHCLDEHDEEARHANWPWYKVLALGPWLSVLQHRNGIVLGDSAHRRWIIAEIGLCVGVVLIAAIAGPAWLGWHVTAMLTGECLAGFFAVWIVHRGCDEHHQIARTQRGWLKNLLSYSMFYHLEHHLWPAVPTCHLPTLAERLDEVEPRFREKQVI